MVWKNDRPGSSREHFLVYVLIHQQLMNQGQIGETDVQHTAERSPSAVGAIVQTGDHWLQRALLLKLAFQFSWHHHNHSAYAMIWVLLLCLGWPSC